MTVPLKGGPTDGIFIPEGKVADQFSTYYRMAGWDTEGKPTRFTLEELGLKWVADELELA